MAVTRDDISALFPCAVYTSAGDADPVSVRQLAPLGSQEIPAGFSSWVEKRQREYRAGRHHARAALEAAGHFDAEVPRGLDGLPRFPEPFSGTITHTGRSKTFAAAAVCRHPIQIGLDAEFVRPLEEGMVDLILSPEEKHLGEKLVGARLPPFHDLGTVALLCFSAKEAFYKCVYPRCRQKLGFHDARVWLRPELGSFVVTLEHRSSEELPAQLEGRYLVKDSLIVSAVTWQPEALKG